MSERTGWTKGMADVEIRTVESLEEPDRYAGWTVISFGDDGSVLIQSKTGVRERVKVVGTVEMQDTIRQLECAIQRWANATQVVGTHRSCSCAVCEALYKAADESKE